MAKNHEININFSTNVIVALYHAITLKFKMQWFLLCLARYSVAQKASELCEPKYTHIRV